MQRETVQKLMLRVAVSQWAVRRDLKEITEAAGPVC